MAITIRTICGVLRMLSDHGRRHRKNVALVVSLVEEKAKREGALKTPDFIGGPGRTRTCNQTVMSGRL